MDSVPFFDSTWSGYVATKTGIIGLLLGHVRVLRVLKGIATAQLRESMALQYYKFTNDNTIMQYYDRNDNMIRCQISRI